MGSMCGFYKLFKMIKALVQIFYSQTSAYVMSVIVIHTYRYLLHLLLHGVDCSGGCGESLDGLGGKNALVLYGHWLELR